LEGLFPGAQVPETFGPSAHYHGAWVSIIALTEAIWVLGSVSGRNPAELAVAIEMLLNHEQLVIQDLKLVACGLATFRSHPALGFSDC
jgi:predicted nucleic-acid-binding protein